MGFGRNAPTGQKLVVDPPGEPARSYRLRIRERDYDVQRIDDLPQAMVHPDPEALARIREEQARVERARDHFTRIGGFREDFSWPVTGRVSGVYGTRRILNGESRQPHFGVDIAAPSGTPVRSPASGVVRLAEPDLYFSGGTVILDHGWGLTSTFLHLESLRVAEGEPVSRGQVLGQAGATGRATGPHLDWRINLGEKRLDPALLAGPMPGGESGLRTGDAGP